MDYWALILDKHLFEFLLIIISTHIEQILLMQGKITTISKHKEYFMSEINYKDCIRGIIKMI